MEGSPDMTEHGIPLRVWLWRRAPLVQRLTFLAVVPAALTALLLTALLTYHQNATLRGWAEGFSQEIATQVLDVSTNALQTGDRRELQRIARAYAQHQYISRVQIIAPDGEILADARNAAYGGKDTLEVKASEPSRKGVQGTVTVGCDVSAALAEQRHTLYNALLWLIASLLAVSLFAWQAARWTSAPLRQLADAVHRLGTGNRRITVPVTEGAEIGELQRGFNATTAALHDAHQGMAEEVARATVELARKNAELENASLAKTRFLAAASHDLRQPLYALTLFSSALKVGEQDPERVHRIVHIQECVASLDRLFSELLDLSLLETGAMQANLAEFPLDPLFEEVSRNFRPHAEERGLRLIARKTDLWVRSDRTMLARILNNLVSNALRYTRTGGVLLGARRRAGSVRIDVWDTGPGIGAEHQALVFQEFYRIETCEPEQPAGADRRRGRGLGLGLATVQRLAELLGTKVLLRSRPGRGSVFCVEVPRSAAGAHDSAQPEEEASLDVAGLRVLVIDDEPAILEGLRTLLQSWECEVRTAENEEQMLHAIAQWPAPPDIVLSDLRLRENRSGLALLQHLDRHYGLDERGQPRFARLLITGETKGERLREIMAAHIPVLYKPVSSQQLREALVATIALVRAPAAMGSETPTEPAAATRLA